ncbi:alpha/beta fold hydrolase [Meridianimarinicoccus aquatilis]|uniref:Alpha/beta hydrolase n=1 Tax=Meridianimarinicoccus aquatilis TaxID=2552766 RepID=A0A4R6AKD8_9RHOB|nr:alpha/beta hydrolase [Fluviibacterium aquatile]TDL83762.1 alpha/beta hydrolase [Fluviibacterium aquatile]
MLVELPNGCINVETRGSGTPVLALHGGGLDHRHMLDALEPVFEESTGWKRVYIDLPGHGYSKADASVQSQDDVLNMISAFIDLVFDGQKLAVIGESRGSYHAMGLAHARPADLLGMMLIVADGMPGSTVDWRPTHQTLVPFSEGIPKRTSPEAAARFGRLVVQSPDILQKIENIKLPAAALADDELATRLNQNFNFSFDLPNPASAFEKPTLIVNGRQDAMAGYQDMMDRFERYPRATLAVLDCAGHSLAWERPELFRALTLDWLHRMSESAT